MAVILCRCHGNISSALDLNAIKTGLEGKGQRVFIGDMLCRDGIDDVLNGSEEKGPLAVGGCWGRAYRDDFRHALLRRGSDPFAVAVVPLLGEKSQERALLQLTAAVERLRLFPGAQGKNLKPRFGKADGALSRRQLFQLPRIRHDLVPSIESERCRSQSRHCRLCLKKCHTGAVVIGEEGTARIEKDKCSGCGACVNACPARAITFPSFTPAEITKEIETLLGRRIGAAPGRRAVLFACENSGLLLHDFLSTGGAIPDGVMPVVVPCLTMLSAFYFLYAFTRGAAGIGLLSCHGGKCRKGAKAEVLTGEIRLADALLREFGIPGERITLIREHSLPELQQGLDEFGERVDRLEPVRLPVNREARAGNGGNPLAALLSSSTRRLTLEGCPTIPCGMVRLEHESSCTFCGVCEEHCPTNSLLLESKDGSRELRFNYRTCIGCGECIRLCPEKTLRMKKVLDTEKLADLQSRLLARESAIACSECGVPFLNEALFRKIRSGFATPEADAVIRMCPDCRARTAFSAFFP